MRRRLPPPESITAFCVLPSDETDDVGINHEGPPQSVYVHARHGACPSCGYRADVHRGDCETLKGAQERPAK